MAQFQNMFKVDLSAGAAPVVPLAQIYYADVEANRVGAVVLLNGEAFPLSGTCSGTAILSDGSTVALTGAIDGNRAYVDLPAGCYSVAGTIQVFVKITAGGVTTTLICAVGTVRLTETGTVIDPGTIIPSVSALIDDIDAAVASIPADYSDLLAAIAPDYADLTFPVKKGTFCWYSGTLYTANQDIDTSESWTAAHWDSAPLANELAGRVAELKSAITDLNESVYVSKTITPTDGYYYKPDGTIGTNASWKTIKARVANLFTTGALQGSGSVATYGDTYPSIVFTDESGTVLDTVFENKMLTSVTTALVPDGAVWIMLNSTNNFTVESVSLFDELNAMGEEVSGVVEVVDAKIADVDEKIDDYLIEQKQFEPVNLLHGTFSLGVLNAQGEVDSAGSTSTTDLYLAVTPRSKVVVTRNVSQGVREAFNIKAIAFYTADKTFVSAKIGGSGQQLQDLIHDVPLTAAFAKISVSTAYTSGYYLMMEKTNSVDNIAAVYSEWFEPFDTLLAKHTTDLLGKNICVFGDSLAASGNGGDDTWIQRVADYYQCANAYNRGIGSSCITNKDKDNQDRVGYAYVDASGDAYNRGMYSTQQTITGYTEISPWMNGEDRANTIPIDTDLVIILAGANDVSTTNESMFKAAYAQMLQNIMTRVPNAKIITCTFVYNHSYDSVPELKAVYDRYRGYIKEVSAEFGFPCIDMMANMGCNNYNYEAYMNADGVHYNTTAGRILTAECVAGFLRQYAKILT